MELLIVDDEKREVAAVKKLLEGMPIEFSKIYEAYNMNEAVEIIKKYPVTMMLCDVEMPGGTGLELTKWVMDYDAGIPVIYLTGHADFSYVRTALRLGAVDYLLKPIEKQCLMEALKKAVAKLPEGEKIEQHMDAETIVNEVKEFVQKYCDKEINRIQLAEKYFIHPDYLSHIFKRQTGFSLSDYIIQTRIAKAKKLLHKTNLPIAKIAIASGYSNTAFFAKHFRRLTGMAPKEYRTALKKDKENE